MQAVSGRKQHCKATVLCSEVPVSKGACRTRNCQDYSGEQRASGRCRWPQVVVHVLFPSEQSRFEHVCFCITGHLALASNIDTSK